MYLCIIIIHLALMLICIGMITGSSLAQDYLYCHPDTEERIYELVGARFLKVVLASGCLGLIIFIISAVTVVVVMKSGEVKCSFYLIAALVITAISTDIAVMAMFSSVRPGLHSILETAMKGYNSSDEVQTFIDDLQNKYKCCGAKGIKDWVQMENQTIPESCCGLEEMNKKNKNDEDEEKEDENEEDENKEEKKKEKEKKDKEDKKNKIEGGKSRWTYNRDEELRAELNDILHRRQKGNDKEKMNENSPDTENYKQEVPDPKLPDPFDIVGMRRGVVRGDQGGNDQENQKAKSPDTKRPRHKVPDSYDAEGVRKGTFQADRGGNEIENINETNPDIGNSIEEEPDPYDADGIRMGIERGDRGGNEIENIKETSPDIENSREEEPDPYDADGIRRGIVRGDRGGNEIENIKETNPDIENSGEEEPDPYDADGIPRGIVRGDQGGNEIENIKETSPDTENSRDGVIDPFDAFETRMRANTDKKENMALPKQFTGVVDTYNARRYLRAVNHLEGNKQYVKAKELVDRYTVEHEKSIKESVDVVELSLPEHTIAKRSGIHDDENNIESEEYDDVQENSREENDDGDKTPESDKDLDQDLENEVLYQPSKEDQGSDNPPEGDEDQDKDLENDLIYKAPEEKGNDNFLDEDQDTPPSVVRKEITPKPVTRVKPQDPPPIDKVPDEQTSKEMNEDDFDFCDGCATAIWYSEMLNIVVFYVTLVVKMGLELYVGTSSCLVLITHHIVQSDEDGVEETRAGYSANK